MIRIDDLRNEIAEKKADLKKAQDANMSESITKRLEARIAEIDVQIKEHEADAAEKAERRVKADKIAAKKMDEVLIPFAVEVEAALAADKRFIVERKDFREEEERADYRFSIVFLIYDVREHYVGVIKLSLSYYVSGSGWGSGHHEIKPNMVVDCGYGREWNRRYTNLNSANVKKAIEVVQYGVDAIQNKSDKAEYTARFEK